MSKASISDYPKINTIGHKYLAKLFNGPVVVQEKVDGSQISFGVINGELKARSKGKEIILDAPDSLFNEAVATIKQLHAEGLLVGGYIYRGEYLKKPKHNALAYSRIPRENIILFDVCDTAGNYVTWDDAHREACLNTTLEWVPTLYTGLIKTQDDVKAFLTQTSVLGGQLIEGVVIKNYAEFGEDGKPIFGKFVSEAFKEVHGQNWKKENPTQRDIRQRLIDKYRLETRWRKAVQTLRDNGQITETPKDIGIILKTIQNDVIAESLDEIKEDLWNFFKGDFTRGIIRGLPEWYKEQLLDRAFLTPTNTDKTDNDPEE